ncbi:cupin domain-containing protein [Bacillus marinisedimentorum]|uniref:cupin domain-containing protein n=1 Tax=Bacillus marinisedimentorum TaxID=1821260 RepID=UPI0007DF0894|nr:cupin domain-containing protein [Bacillus marinisedimentorum]
MDMNNLEVRSFHFDGDGSIPNNKNLDLIVYRDAVGDTGEMGRLFEKNNWKGTWLGGVSSIHHYHSTTHEVLGVVSGKATLKMGGEHGEVLNVEQGDVLIIPAGVGHKHVESTHDFKVCGAYPDGMEYDLQTGKPEEQPDVAEIIQNVPLPKQDPLYGDRGPLFSYWNQ